MVDVGSGAAEAQGATTAEHRRAGTAAGRLLRCWRRTFFSSRGDQSGLQDRRLREEAAVWRVSGGPEKALSEKTSGEAILKMIVGPAEKTQPGVRANRDSAGGSCRAQQQYDPPHFRFPELGKRIPRGATITSAPMLHLTCRGFQRANMGNDRCCVPCRRLLFAA